MNKALIFLCMSMAVSMTLAGPTNRQQSQSQSSAGCYQYQSSNGTSIQIGEGCKQSQSSSGTSGQQQQGSGTQTQWQSGSGTQTQSQGGSFEWKPIEWKPFQWQPIQWQPMNGGQAQARQSLPINPQNYQKMIEELMNAYKQSGINGVLTLIAQKYPELQAYMPLIQQFLPQMPQTRQLLLPVFDEKTKEMIQAIFSAYQTGGPSAVLTLIAQKYPALQAYTPLIQQFMSLDLQQQQQQLQQLQTLLQSPLFQQFLQTLGNQQQLSILLPLLQG